MLKFARDIDIDMANFNLKTAHVKIVGGYIFVAVAEKPPIFPDHLESLLLSRLEPLDLENSKVVHQERIVESGNWKLVWENNRECYHCNKGHPELWSFPTDIERLRPGSAEFDSHVAWLSEVEALGLPSEYITGDNNQYRCMRLPLAKGAQSMTLTGEPAVKNGKVLGRMPKHEDANVGDALFYHYPSVWNHKMADYAATFRVLPISPTKTELTTTWFVNNDAIEGEDYEKDDVTAVWHATNKQDRRFVEGTQAGVESLAYSPGPYNSIHEIGVAEFVDWYTDTMVKRLEEEEQEDENFYYQQ
jgi:Rieske 2Fe-2S family protein